MCWKCYSPAHLYTETFCSNHSDPQSTLIVFDERISLTNIWILINNESHFTYHPVQWAWYHCIFPARNSASFSTGQHCKGASGPSCDLMHECPYDGSEIQHKACIVRQAVFQMQCIVTLSLPKPASSLVRMPRESALGLAVRMIPFCPTSNHFALSYSPPFLDMSFLLLHSFDLRMPWAARSLKVRTLLDFTGYIDSPSCSHQG